MSQRYDIGDLVTVVANFAAPTTLTPTNPSTITLRIRKPTGTVTVVAAAALTNSATGEYRYDISPDISGVWWYRFEGAGLVTAAGEDYFEVRPSRVI